MQRRSFLEHEQHLPGTLHALAQLACTIREMFAEVIESECSRVDILRCDNHGHWLTRRIIAPLLETQSHKAAWECVTAGQDRVA